MLYPSEGVGSGGVEHQRLGVDAFVRIKIGIACCTDIDRGGSASAALLLRFCSVSVPFLKPELNLVNDSDLG